MPVVQQPSSGGDMTAESPSAVTVTFFFYVANVTVVTLLLSLPPLIK
jgi:hypothetical protein